MPGMFMADFETTTDPNDCRTWAACAVDMDNGEVVHISNNIDTFMEWLEKVCSAKVYFHNLKFDGEFILSWLFRNGFQHVGHDIRAIPKRCFQTLIDDMGQFYKLTICFDRGNKKVKRAEIYDSLKKLPSSAKKIAKDYGLPISKGEIDYTKPREPGYIPTEEETDYIVTDCKIIQMALSFQFQEGMKKMTIAADSLNFYREMMGRKFEHWFPVLPITLDDDIRAAYKGGFTWCKPEFAGKDIGKGIVLDVNSLYPDAMYSNPLPWGYPAFFEGEPEPDDDYPLFIVRIRCAFELKPNHIPTIQIKGKNRMWNGTEYLKSSRLGEELMLVDLTLTSVDLKLFLDHYNTYDLEYICGYRFKAQNDMFKEYIDHWMHIKETSPKNSAQRAIAKLHLNSLYGKFASSTKRYNKTPVMCPDGVVRYYCRNVPLLDKDGNIQFDAKGRILYEKDEKGKPLKEEPGEADPIYTPVAAFITAYARYKTITSAQALYDRFIYADTDSLHLIGEELPDNLDIHPTKLGAWDFEKAFDRGRFIRAKTYIEEVDGVLHVTCAGMPDNVKELVTWENFHAGTVYPGKLLPKRVPGGIVLDPVDFSIKV